MLDREPGHRVRHRKHVQIHADRHRVANPAQTALVLIDGCRYSKLTCELAHAARAEGAKVTLITDPFCDWGRDAADEMFAVQTDLNHFWDATSAMSSLVSLIINGVFNELGLQVVARMARVSSLYGDFIGHTGAGYGRGRMKT